MPWTLPHMPTSLGSFLWAINLSWNNPKYRAIVIFLEVDIWSLWEFAKSEMKCSITCSGSRCWSLFKNHGDRNFYPTSLSQTHRCTWPQSVCTHQDSSSLLCREVTAGLGYLGGKSCQAALNWCPHVQPLGVSGEVSLSVLLDLALCICPTSKASLHSQGLFSSQGLHFLLSGLQLLLKNTCLLFSDISLLFFPDWEPSVFPVRMV